jgi:hypothetical protein
VIPANKQAGKQRDAKVLTKPPEATLSTYDQEDQGRVAVDKSAKQEVTMETFYLKKDDKEHQTIPRGNSKAVSPRSRGAPQGEEPEE